MTAPNSTNMLLAAIANAAGLPSIPDTILRHQPLGGGRGAKVIVVTRAPLERIGGIHIPQVAQQRESDGWVIAASIDVGNDGSGALAPYVIQPESFECDPNLAVGLAVTWGRFVGTILRVSDMDDPLDSRFLLMVEDDLLTVIGRIKV